MKNAVDQIGQYQKVQMANSMLTDIKSPIDYL